MSMSEPLLSTADFGQLRAFAAVAEALNFSRAAEKLGVSSSALSPVVRALEGNAIAHHGRLRAGEGTTDLVIGPGFVPRVVDGLLSGVHEPGTSHYRVVSAFGPQK